MKVALILCTALVAGSAHAQDPNRFYPPEGCTAQLTVQSRSCGLSNIYTCAADAPGENWRVEFDVDGPIFISKIDYETQWLESYDLFPTNREVLVQPADDPASLTELLATGTDAYDFVQTGETGPVRVVGFDRLTGEEVVIDGEPLLVTEFDARHETTDGVILEVTGREYVSVRHRRFIAGMYTGDGVNGTFEYDKSPVDFIYPGEPGFFSRTPL